MIYKFVQWTVPDLASLHDTRYSRIHRCLESGHALTREDKDYMFTDLARSFHGKSRVPLHGWMFDFSPWLRTYWVQLRDHGICQYSAFDKTSIRNYFGCSILRIVDVTQ